ncbi:MAG: hypothetical protein JW866_09950 [Ignavibacteriales bacterium]|nr:hypothetical protein [Ignavibacteriales bacterium]
MKHLQNFAVGILIILTPCLCFSQEEREAEARKLYLEASKLVRAEEFQKAERILKQILDDYIDTEIALKADEC